MTGVAWTWQAPAGMAVHVERAWREFFRKAASGTAGYTATAETYVILYKVQLGRCFICQTAKGINPEDPKGKGSQRLGWDHNHATGAVRGLLCTKGQWSCNRIVGRYRDNPQAFLRGYRYLEAPPALVLAWVQKQGWDMTAEEKIRAATQILGVAPPTVTVESGGKGYQASEVVMDEVDITGYLR